MPFHLTVTFFFFLSLNLKSLMFGYKRGEGIGMEDEVPAINCAVEQGLPGVGSSVGILPWSVNI